MYGCTTKYMYDRTSKIVHMYGCTTKYMYDGILKIVKVPTIHITEDTAAPRLSVRYILTENQRENVGPT